MLLMASCNFFFLPVGIAGLEYLANWAVMKVLYCLISLNHFFCGSLSSPVNSDFLKSEFRSIVLIKSLICISQTY